MDVSKMMETAITVAAIVGTCVFSSPSFAAWSSDAPGKLSSDIAASAYVEGDGLVAVGAEGKVFRVSSPTGEFMSWTQVYPDITADLVGVVADDPSNAGNNDFVAVTKDGKVFFAETAAGIWTDITNNLGDSLNGKTVVGIASVVNDKYVVVASDGTFVLTEDKGANWASKGSAVSSADLAGKGINGVVAFDSEHVLVFGKNAGDDTKNILKVKASDGSVVSEYKVANCGNINTVAVTSAGVFVAGDKGAVVKLDVDLTDAAAAPALTVSGTPPSLTDVFNAVDYNVAEKSGYVAGNAGKMYRIVPDGSGYNLEAVTGTGVTKNLNALTLVPGTTISDAKNVLRAVACGDDGTSVYSDEVFWKKNKKFDPNTSAIKPASVAADGSSFYAFSTSGSYYESTTKGEKWTYKRSRSNLLTSGQRMFIYTKSDNTKHFVTAGTDNTAHVTAVVDFSPDSSYPKKTDSTQKLADLKHFAMAGDYVFATSASGKRIHYGEVGTAVDMSTQYATADNCLENGASAITATAKGVYFIDRGAVKAMLNSSDNLTVSPDGTNNGVKELAQVTTLLGSTAPLRMFESTANNEFVVVGAGAGGDTKIFFFSDSGVGASVDATAGAAGYTLVATVDSSVIKAAEITGFWGSHSDFSVSTATGVWRYTSSAWVEYGGVTATTDVASVSGVAALGADLIAVDDGTALAFSKGSEFTYPGTSNFPAATKIFTAFNATKSDIYVAGQSGLITKGVKNTNADSIDWRSERYADSFFGAKSFKKVTGAGDQVFAVYGTQNKDIVHKTLTEESWNKITVSSGEIDGVRDMQALDAGTLYIANSNSPGLIKGIVTDDQVAYIDQAMGDGEAMPASLSSLSVPDAKTVFGINGKKLYKFSEPSGNDWKIANIAPTDGAQNLYDVVALSADKVYAVGNSGYAIFYDGTKTTVLPKAPDNVTLRSCWACEGYLYAVCSSYGKQDRVYTFNVETNAWTHEEVADGNSLYDITGSLNGRYLFAVGSDGVAYLNKIGSDSGGGAAGETYVTNITGDSAVVDSEVPKHLGAEALASAYNTPPEMAVVCDVQEFTTTGGVNAGTTHTFTFNFTPTADYAFNEVVLYKLKTDGSNLAYNRLSAAPATPTSGDFWITTTGGDAVGAGQTLASGTAYSVCFAIEDNSRYDNDSTPGKITDPAVLGTSSGSGSSGCVFNPAQTFGMEWLMLAFAPLAAIFRSRFKR